MTTRAFSTSKVIRFLLSHFFYNYNTKIFLIKQEKEKTGLLDRSYRGFIPPDKVVQTNAKDDSAYLPSNAAGRSDRVLMGQSLNTHRHNPPFHNHHHVHREQASWGQRGKKDILRLHPATNKRNPYTSFFYFLSAETQVVCSSYLGEWRLPTSIPAGLLYH